MNQHTHGALARMAVAAALAVCAASPAIAADFYVGGAIGGSDYGASMDMPDFTMKPRDTGYKLLAGARLTPNFALEGGYVHLGNAKIQGRISDVAVEAKVAGSGVFVDAVGILPLQGDWSLFGRVGVIAGKLKVSGWAEGEHGSASDSGTGGRFGFGAAYALSKAATVRVEWERSRFSADFNGTPLKGNVDLLSVGLTYAF